MSASAVQKNKAATSPAMVINLGPLRTYVTPQQFERICLQNPDYCVELTKTHL